MPNSNKSDEIFYGQFNNIKKKPFRRRVETNSNNFLKHARDATRETLFENNLTIEGDFYGYVLSKPCTTEADSLSQKKSFLQGWLKSEPQVRQYKVRVPEVHSMIPMPKNKEDSVLIDMHDTFEIISDEIDNLAPGTVVRVSFYDNNGNYHPTIKEKIHKISFPEVDASAAKFKKGPPQLDIPPPSQSPIGSGRKAEIEVPKRYPKPPLESSGDDLKDLERLFDSWGIRHFEAFETIRHYNEDWVNDGGARQIIPPRRFWNNMELTIKMADQIRNQWGSKVNVTSGYRTPDYNDNYIGGKKNSQHKVYKALDLYPANGNYREFAFMVENIVHQYRQQGISTGFGVYPKKNTPFVHIDTGHRSLVRRWPDRYFVDEGGRDRLARLT